SAVVRQRTHARTRARCMSGHEHIAAGARAMAKDFSYAPPMVDTHAHVIAADERRYPRAPLGGRQSAWSRERPVSADEMLAAMDAAGIDRTVLVQASTCYGHDNSYLADAVAAQPRRFVGVFSVDMLAADAPAQIQRWMARGLAGLRVFIAGHTTAQDVRLDDPRSYAAWQCAL